MALPKSTEWPKTSQQSLQWLHFECGLEVYGRIARSAFSNVLLDPSNMAGISLAATVVMGSGMYEGYLLSNPVIGRNAFMVKYAWENVFPSIIWGTKPADIVAKGIGLDPKVLLRDMTPTSKNIAKDILKIQGAFTLRSIIAGFVGIAQIFNLVSQGTQASQRYADSLYTGNEPFLKNTISERVIRFAGETSDVTLMSIDRDGEHIIPVVVEPSLWRKTINLLSRDGTIPVFWAVPRNEYGHTEHWDGFKIDPKWFIKSKSGKKHLIVEGDSSVGEEALALAEEHSNDLSLQEASQGFRIIRDMVRQNKTPAFEDVDVIRVLLADTAAPLVMGGGHRFTLKDFLSIRKEVDILIDAKKPLIHSILSWAKEYYGADARGHKNIVFDTTNKRYFGTIKKLLDSHGFNIIELGQVPLNEERELPRLVYHDSTVDTVNTIKMLMDASLVKHTRCCALLDNKEGLEDVQNLNKSLPGNEVHHICSAVIYDDLFRKVRSLVRDDVPLVDIQQQVDDSYTM